MCRVLLGKQIITQLVMKFSAFYGTWRFIPVYKQAHHWPQTLICTNPVRTLPHHSIRSIWILSPSATRSSKWFLPFRCSDNNSVCISHFPLYAICLPTASALIWSFESYTFSLVPHSQSPSVCVCPLMWALQFHIHEKQQVKLQYFSFPWKY
jgi:hypothetical protein